jgi:hypothetical protein
VANGLHDLTHLHRPGHCVAPLGFDFVRTRLWKCKSDARLTQPVSQRDMSLQQFARSPVTGSCPFLVVRLVEMERKRPEEDFSQNALWPKCVGVRLSMGSRLPARDIQRITRPLRCLTLGIHCQLHLNRRNKNEAPPNSKRLNYGDGSHR